MEDINLIKEKYEKFVISNLNKENFNNIILFLFKENCNFIEDIISDYLDLFNIPYEEFVKKYNILNKKYDFEFLERACNDMNLFEEFYNI